MTPTHSARFVHASPMNVLVPPNDLFVPSRIQLRHPPPPLPPPSPFSFFFPPPPVFGGPQKINLFSMKPNTRSSICIGKKLLNQRIDKFDRNHTIALESTLCCFDLVHCAPENQYCSPWFRDRRDQIQYSVDLATTWIRSTTIDNSRSFISGKRSIKFTTCYKPVWKHSVIARQFGNNNLWHVCDISQLYNGYLYTMTTVLVQFSIRGGTVTVVSW